MAQAGTWGCDSPTASVRPTLPTAPRLDAEGMLDAHGNHWRVLGFPQLPNQHGTSDSHSTGCL